MSEESDTLQHIKIRLATDTDYPLIYSSWLKSFADADQARLVTKSVYYQEHHALIDKLIAKKALFFVACSKHDDDHVYGWICVNLASKPQVVHYVYVKQIYRKIGIANYLMEMVQKPYIYTQKNRFQPEDCTHNYYELFREVYT